MISITLDFHARRPSVTIAGMRAAEVVSRARTAYDGWLIVGVVFLAAALSIGSSSYAFGLFVEPLERTFGWQRAAISASLSFMAVGSITSPIIGRLMDRHGARLIMAVSLVVMSISFLMRPLMTELWHWYALSFLQFVCFAGASSLPAGRLVAIWFPRSRGRVMGITMMGNNFGGATMPYITWVVLASASWRAAFVVLGAIGLGIAVLTILLIHENFNRGAGRSDDEGQGPHAGPALTGSTVREALGTGSFYTMTLALTLATVTYSGILPWVSAHLANEGMSPGLVVRAVTVLAIFGMMGKLAFGYLADRITARRSMMLCLGGQGFFVLMMVVYSSEPMVWISVPLFGFCMGAYGVLSTLVVQESFGVKYFGSISGLIGVPGVVSLVGGPLLAGASFDITGSYGPAFTSVAVMFAVAILLLTQVGRS